MAARQFEVEGQGWRTLESPVTQDEFEVATDLYYIDVSKQ
jgi:hypothetical protein